MKKYFITYSALSLAISIACSQTTAGGAAASGGTAASGSPSGGAAGGVVIRPAPPIANPRTIPQQPGNAPSIPQNPNPNAANPLLNENGTAPKANPGFATNQPPLLGVNSNGPAFFTNNARSAVPNSPVAVSNSNNASGGANFPMGRDFAATPGDQAILARLRQIMPQNSPVASATPTPVFFTVNSGVVTLSGDIVTPDARPRLAAIAQQIPGVVGINDQLVVTGNASNADTANRPGGVIQPSPLNSATKSTPTETVTSPNFRIFGGTNAAITSSANRPNSPQPTNPNAQTNFSATGRETSPNFRIFGRTNAAITASAPPPSNSQPETNAPGSTPTGSEKTSPNFRIFGDTNAAITKQRSPRQQ